MSNVETAMQFNRDLLPPGAKIKVIGVGGGGSNAINTMIRSGVEGVEFAVANTDVQSLKASLSDRKIQIGKELTRGLGAGADPDIGRDAALEDRHEIQEALADADMVFITAGMGGGTGTGGAAVIAQIAKELGALTVGVVTKPFTFEGRRRQKHGEIGIARLRENVDTLIVIPNQRLLQIATPQMTMLEAFRLADDVLVNAVRGISDIINIPGTINVDFADVKSVMSSMGQALMGIGQASGENRAVEAATQAISSPLLEDIDIEGATGILINITAGPDVGIMEINEACSVIQEAAHEDANIIFGAVIDESLTDAIRVTVIATGFPNDNYIDEEIFNSQRTVLASAKDGIMGRSRPIIDSRRHPRVGASSAAIHNTRARHAQQQMVREEAASQANADRFTTESLAQMTLTNIAQGHGTRTPSEAAPIHHEPIVTPKHDPIQEAISDLQPAPMFEPRMDTASFFMSPDAPKMEIHSGNMAHATSEHSPMAASFADEINRSIDDALNLADSISMQNRESIDNLDIPTFLRNEIKNLNV
jgi:cell division protein FtsZ